ncbi:MAG: fuconate dehydratase [Moorea sp. SIO3C2]|nr:fuconate dehydratase [Moorena sp. SIO3C2]
MHGSDAMHTDPDYSAAYVRLHTDGATGYGHTFTIGRGNDLCVAAIQALVPLVIGRRVDEPAALAALARAVVGDSQFRWLGPEKGVVHLAAAAIINAAWDAYARSQEAPLWRVIAALEPADLVDQVDFRYLTDRLTRGRALELLQERRYGLAERIDELERDGIAAYTTSAGWLGYTDDHVVRGATDAVDAGFTMLKMKVGASLDDDVRRLRLVRRTVGPDVRIAIDANQRWEVDEAVTAVERLAEFDISFVEEPTSPDDILGHAELARRIAPIPVASGEHCHNRVMFKQFLAAEAMQVCQIDACRVGGVNENLAILLLAADAGVPVVPHAGGVGLCEVVRHLAFADAAAISAPSTGRVIEFADHLHEHFADPAVVRNGRYVAPRQPGSSAAMLDASVKDYTFPDGAVWQRRAHTA